MTTEVIPSNAGDGSPPGHIDKMLGLGDGKPAPKEGEEGYVAPTGDQVAKRPDNVPEKFWNAEKGEINTEALLKSQADAEAALRQGTAPKEGEEGYVKPEPKEGEEGYVAPNQAAAVEAASAEWAEKGELSDATYTSLESKGLTRSMVDTYIEGQKAIVSNLQDAAYGPFENKEGYETAANWAAEHMDEAAIKALDVQLTSSNPAIVAQGAKALAAKYVAEADVEPNTIRGDGNTGTTGGVYASSREMMKDMNSAKYRTSQAFRDEVAAKLARSSI